MQQKQHYTSDELRQVMRDSIIRQEWEEVFAPPEGKYGQGGADPTTELKGFKRDADTMIIEPMLNQFKSGGSTENIADAFTALAYRQNNASAGAFARHMSLNIRNRIAPDYLSQKAEQQIPEMTADHIMEQLQDIAKSSDAQQILTNLQARTHGKDGMTAQTLVGELKSIGDEYDRVGDEFLAEEADLMREAVTGLLAGSGRQEQVRDLARQWATAERNWDNPLSAHLSTQAERPTQKKTQNNTRHFG